MCEKQICRLCLEKLSGVEGEKINNVKMDMLKLLLVELQFSMHNDVMICSGCFKKLKLYFDFKKVCLKNNTQLKTLHMNNSGETLNLEKQKFKQLFIEVPANNENMKVCRFCLKYCIMDQCIFLDKMEQDIFFKDLIIRSLPELDLSLTLEPVICFECMETLQSLFNFIVGCFDANEIIQHYITSVELEDGKHINLCDVFDFMLNLKTKAESDFNWNQNKAEEEDCNSNNNDCDIDIKEESPDEQCYLKETHKINKAHSSSKVQSCPFFVEYYSVKEQNLFACYHCPYKTTIRASLVLHLLVHKKSDEISKIKCNMCDFETKWRSSLRTHMYLHMHKSELPMYKCANCKYQSKFKKHLRRHMDIHKTSKFKCDDCSFITKNLMLFRSHRQRVHNVAQAHAVNEEALNKVTLKKMYKCTFCSYETLRCYRIKDHIVKHQKEAPTFKCDLCSFQSKHKASVRHHMKTHKSITEEKLKPSKIKQIGVQLEP